MKQRCENRLLFNNKPEFSLKNKNKKSFEADKRIPQTIPFQFCPAAEKFGLLKEQFGSIGGDSLNGPSRKTSKGKRQIPLRKQEPNPPQLYRKRNPDFPPLPSYICVLLHQRKRRKESHLLNSPVSNQPHTIIGKRGDWPQLPPKN